MSGASPPLLEIRGVTRQYHGLRPLRLSSLTVGAGERVSISGLDAGAGELIVNLVTGASLPDAGEVRVFGRLTSEIASGDDWLASLDGFGIVSPRAVLLEGSTLQQNLAMPFTLDIEPVDARTADVVERLAGRCGIGRRWLPVPAGELPPDVRVRAHLARAIALEPRLLIVEHPTAQVPPEARRQLAADVAAAMAGALTGLILSNDEPFARAVAPRNLKLDGATGRLKPLARGWLTW